MSKLDFTSKRTWGALAAIGLIVGALAAAFAWTAGWIDTRLTSSQLFTETPQPFPPGFRRAHGKGICIAGTFRPTDAVAPLSTARVFTQPNLPVVGRLAIAMGDPHGADSASNVVSMALMLKTDDGQQWRMAMNNQPYFPTHNAEGFAVNMPKALAPDPATGKPDPERVAAFLKAYPEAEKFLKWAAQAPNPASFSGVEFDGINAFYLVAADGKRQAVRWFMRPQEPFLALDPAQIKHVGHDFMFDDLRARLAQKPLRWDMVMQLAQPGDPVDDPSQPWPQDRKQVVAGTLEVTQAIEQAVGPCRDVNFDPTIVPTGIALSNDPVLEARSAAYTHSFNRREREIGYGKATEAIGEEAASK